MHRSAAEMDGEGGYMLDEDVILVENEAESVQVPEEKCAAGEQIHLDRCPVCHLNLHSRDPKLLPCLHSLCNKCLPSPSRKLATTRSPNSFSNPLNVIRCPVCRQECLEVDVVENIFAKDSVEAPSSTMERTLQWCTTCDDNSEAAGFCVNCVEYLCATCVVAHQRVKLTRDHTIRQKAPQEVLGVSPHRAMFCDIHKQEPLKLFCETCELLTCRDCQLVKHRDHKYQFLEDAYKSHKVQLESMTHQLEEKKNLIEEVSTSIKTGLLRVDQDHSTVQDDIQKCISTLIEEIKKKGEVLVKQLEIITKRHKDILQRQQDDISSLSRHVDHVISFTKCATARRGCSALLHHKRLILFQIGNLLRANCSTSFVARTTVQFQCRSSYVASDINLGSIVVRSAPHHQQRGAQGVLHQVASGLPHSSAVGAPLNSLVQLQMQVEKLKPQAHWQQQPPPPASSCYQSVPLQAVPLRGHPSSCNAPPQPACRFTGASPRYSSAESSFPSPRITPQPARSVGSSTVEPLGVQGQQNLPGSSSVSREELPGAAHCRPSDTYQDVGDVSPAAKRRPRSSTGPVIVIKDEPLDRSYAQATQRASLPDSTGDRVPERKPSRPQHLQQRALDGSYSVSCDVCLTGGELQRCHKCPRLFHLSCHVPALHKPPSGEWFCSVCRDPSEPEAEYGSSPEAVTVKIEPDSEGGFAPEDKRKCEKLLLHLFCCGHNSGDSGESDSPSVCAKSRPTVKGAMKFSTVRKRLEATQSPSYQSPAEFVSDIRLVLNSTAHSEEADGKLREVFEEHLRTVFPDQIFPEIKLEMAPSSPGDFHLSSLEDVSQAAKRPRLCTGAEEAAP